MAEDINKVMLVGRLTRDAELSYTNSGFALCKFSLAVNRRRKQGDQWVDEANFFDLHLWGRRGESLNSYLTKGTQVAVEGQLRQERWEQDGAKRSKVTIEAVNIQLLGGRSEGSSYNQGGQSGGYGNNNSYQQQPQRQAPPQSQNSQSFESYTPPSQPRQDNYEDDIPF
ncbi:MAG: single-stranded DNA-binding protein [Spirochaetales bacterium]|nr:single-stranded DNA-binding protein [Spirochaetales bacterium]